MLVANRASTEVIDVWGKLKIEEKVVHIAQRNQKRGVKEKNVNREKHEKDKMTEDSNTHGSEEPDRRNILLDTPG
jgi:hypothetical protein